ELVQRRDDVLRVTREEEEKFLDTIDAGMARFDVIAPVQDADAAGERRVVSGEDAFRLHDTHGFPLDLTELIARERGYEVDTAGFERALEEQRERSRQDRRAAGVELSADTLAEGWTEYADDTQDWVGYDTMEVDTEVTAVRREDGRVALRLRRNPFYVEAGGQVSDRGVVEGEGWKVRVDDVRRVGTSAVVIGDLEG